MKHLFVSDFVRDENSGAAGSILALGGALERAGHRVHYAWKRARPGRIPHATASRLLELPRRQLNQIAEILQTETYDAVTVSQPYAYLAYERLAPRFRGTVFLNRTHGWEGRVYEAQRRFRWDGRDPDRWTARVSAALTRRACARTARASRGVITSCERCAAWIRQAYGLSPNRVQAIAEGLGPEFLEDTSPRPAPGQRMMYVGNFLPLKGSAVLEAILPDLAVRYPGASVTFVVDREAATRVEARFRPTFGDRLVVHTWVDRSRLPALYAAHDILLFPSLFEGFGKVWLEAMSGGLCVVGFREGGLPDVARHGDTAWYCDTGDVPGLRALLAHALEHAAETRAMGERARARAREYTWDRAAALTIAFCRALGTAA
jgi:glycosyltransferase involved in cell wall biosynthesis